MDKKIKDLVSKAEGQQLIHKRTKRNIEIDKDEKEKMKKS